MKVVVRKDVYNELYDKLFILKGGVCIGTISGHSIKTKDNPARWEVLTDDNVLKYASEKQRRIYFANKAHYVDSSVKQIQGVNASNYKLIATSEFNQMDIDIADVNNPIVCKLLKKPVVSISRHILNPKKHSLSERIIRTSLLPFVFPIIQKYGVFAGNRIESDGTKSTELIARAKITVKGKVKKVGISVVLKETNSSGVEFAFISVFPVESNLIKSYI